MAMMIKRKEINKMKSLHSRLFGFTFAIIGLVFSFVVIGCSNFVGNMSNYDDTMFERYWPNNLYVTFFNTDWLHRQVEVMDKFSNGDNTNIYYRVKDNTQSLTNERIERLYVQTYYGDLDGYNYEYGKGFALTKNYKIGVFYIYAAGEEHVNFDVVIIEKDDGGDISSLSKRLDAKTIYRTWNYYYYEYKANAYTFEYRF